MSAFMNALRPGLRAVSGPSLAARNFSTSSSRSAARMILTGRLAAEPELQATASGQEVIKYAVGSSTGPKTDRRTSWFRVSAFQEGGQREFLLSLPKGTLVYVEADASVRSYDDAEGKKQTRTNFTQRTLEVLKRPFNSEANSEIPQ